MDYQNWSDEYSAEAQKLKEKIRNLREELKNSVNINNKELNRRITILYSMYLECKKTAVLLKERSKGEIVCKPFNKAG
ncbi:MAG: hypothetical protein ACI4I4_06380 [Acutalibacteraceae bacterium]